MESSLLAPKLYFPPARSAIVSRPRLIQRLNAGLAGQLTLISAPAGYGKTTLMSEWRTGSDAHRPAAWVSLDERDNDHIRFLQYLVRSLDMLQPGMEKAILPLLQTPEKPPLDTILTLVINRLEKIQQDFVLVLDDYQLIESKSVHQHVAFLLDHQPRRLHLVVLTRIDPPLPLARLRARGQLMEIRAEQLRFTDTETLAFLNDVMGLSINVSDASALANRTEGWIAGLQLAGLSMQGRQDISEFISAFTGSHHYIVDYLVDEVLTRQSKPMRDFLLSTSVLERVTGPLCDAITGHRDGQAMLEKLAQSNLFLFPLDNERRWFRYHRLFADALSSRLKYTAAEALLEVHTRAGEWCEQNGLTDMAIEHWIAARDWSRAGTLMESLSQQAMRASETGKLIVWARSIPEDVLLKHPTLCINYAWALLLTGQPAACAVILQQIESSVHSNPDQFVDWLAIEAYLARGKGEMQKAMQLAHQALAIPETRSIESQSILGLTLAITYWHMGKPALAAPIAERAAHQAELAENWQVWATMLGLLARIRAAQGHLHQAVEIYLQVDRGHLSAPEWTGSGIAQSGLAAIYYEWNQLDRAEQYARKALQYSELTGHGEIKMSSHRLLARIFLAKGNPEKAMEELSLSIEAVRQHNLNTMMEDRVYAEYVQIELVRGNLHQAEEALAQVQGRYGAAFHYPHIPLEVAMVQIARDQKVEASQSLVEAYQVAQADGSCYAMIEVRILQALAADKQARSMDFLIDALQQAHPEEYVRVFADHRQGLVPLLRQAIHQGIETEYATRLLHVCNESRVGSSASPRHELLSKREIELLRLIASGCSNKEIAVQLIISIGTVKRHTVNIFNKLDVKNRTEAVARARELCLL